MKYHVASVHAMERMTFDNVKVISFCHARCSMFALIKPDSRYFPDAVNIHSSCLHIHSIYILRQYNHGQRKAPIVQKEKGKKDWQQKASEGYRFNG
jgi:hypothetical protein